MTIKNEGANHSPSLGMAILPYLSPTLDKQTSSISDTVSWFYTTPKMDRDFGLWSLDVSVST